MSDWSEEYRRGYIHGKSKGIKKGLKLRKDYVRVVRCEECKEWAKTIGDEGFSLGRCELLGRDLVMNKGFCAWGVRKDDAHE